MTAIYFPLGLLLSLIFAGIACSADTLPAAKKATPFNLEKRELWTTNNIHGTPDPADPFTTQDAFPKLKFFEPLSAGLVPGTKRMGIATRPGRIYTFELRPDVDTSDGTRQRSVWSPSSRGRSVRSRNGGVLALADVPRAG